MLDCMDKSEILTKPVGVQSDVKSALVSSHTLISSGSSVLSAFKSDATSRAGSLKKEQRAVDLSRNDCVIGRSVEFAQVLNLVERAAPSNTSVLLLGESGTGKEVVADILHKNSSRRYKPFVVVDCSGLTETLFESELFGYEKGSFTGAYTNRDGLVDTANGGTLFLDEIGEVPLSQQVKLLRLIETNTYRKVGGVETLQADFRLICATHRNLKAMVEAGDFRQDLYYRINVFSIYIPALRERSEDICLIADAFLDKLSPGRKVVLSQEAQDYLMAYEFPGNIRELRNMLERAVLLTDTGRIGLSHLTDDSQSLKFQ